MKFKTGIWIEFIGLNSVAALINHFVGLPHGMEWMAANWLNPAKHSFKSNQLLTSAIYFLFMIVCGLIKCSSQSIHSRKLVALLAGCWNWIHSWIARAKTAIHEFNQPAATNFFPRQHNVLINVAMRHSGSQSILNLQFSIKLMNKWSQFLGFINELIEWN